MCARLKKRVRYSQLKLAAGIIAHFAMWRIKSLVAAIAANGKRCQEIASEARPQDRLAHRAVAAYQISFIAICIFRDGVWVDVISAFPAIDTPEASNRDVLAGTEKLARFRILKTSQRIWTLKLSETLVM